MAAKKSKQSKNALLEAASLSEDSLVISYLALRITVGILGILLPFVVSLGGQLIFNEGLQSSISSYYYTGMRDVFVGTLWTIGFFLYSYNGYERRDEIAGNLACGFAVGTSLFPTAADGATSRLAEFIGDVHLFFAALFFLTLIYFSFFLFTKTNTNKQSTPEKLQRNIVYKTCAYVMFVCVLLMAIVHFLPQDVAVNFATYKPVYWLEAAAIIAFGISWFVKGGAILADK